ncbi:MAG: hypothetical protein AAGG99_04890, partial [Pseudomonadota bacterium]
MQSNTVDTGRVSLEAQVDALSVAMARVPATEVQPPSEHGLLVALLLAPVTVIAAMAGVAASVGDGARAPASVFTRPAPPVRPGLERPGRGTRALDAMGRLQFRSAPPVPRPDRDLPRTSHPGPISSLAPEHAISRPAPVMSLAHALASDARASAAVARLRTAPPVAQPTSDAFAVRTALALPRHPPMTPQASTTVRITHDLATLNNQPRIAVDPLPQPPLQLTKHGRLTPVFSHLQIVVPRVNPGGPRASAVGGVPAVEPPQPARGGFVGRPAIVQFLMNAALVVVDAVVSLTGFSLVG